MDCFRLISFQTDLGWAGILSRDSSIRRMKFGFGSEIHLLKSFDEYFDAVTPNRIEENWSSQIKKFASGKPTDLSALNVDFSSFTAFQTKVLKQCRKIPYGSTMSYGQLAQKVSAPRAARAVGTAMKRNRCPLVVPCHRVVSSSGIGGYSAADGISIKRRLLELEGAIVG